MGMKGVSVGSSEDLRPLLSAGLGIDDCMREGFKVVRCMYVCMYVCMYACMSHQLFRLFIFVVIQVHPLNK
jgi:hypothetical protein